MCEFLEAELRPGVRGLGLGLGLGLVRRLRCLRSGPVRDRRGGRAQVGGTAVKVEGVVLVTELEAWPASNHETGLDRRPAATVQCA